MSEYIGDFLPGALVVKTFNTASDAATNGALATLISGAALVYSGTQTSGNAVGLTLSANVYSLAQSNPHQISINTAANSTFYVGNSEFQVVLSGGTIGTTSVVGSVVFSFSILNRAPRSSTTTGRVDVGSVNGSNNAAINLASFPPVTTSASMFGATTVIDNSTKISALLGTPTIGGTPVASVSVAVDTLNSNEEAIYDRLGSPAGADIAADIASVKDDTSTTRSVAITTLNALPSNFYLLNITAGGAVLGQAATAGTMTLCTTVTTLTNLPSIPANWLTSAGIAASALNGKGDWLLSSSYTVPPTIYQIWGALRANFTVSNSVGAWVLAGTPQTGDNFALLGTPIIGVTPVATFAIAINTLNSNEEAIQDTLLQTQATVNSLPTAAQINTALSTDHGTGSWQAFSGVVTGGTVDLARVVGQNGTGGSTTMVIDLSTSSRNANIISINSSTEAAIAMSLFSTRSIDAATRTLNINPNSTVATVTNAVTVNIDNATNAKNANVVSINSSTAAAINLSNFPAITTTASMFGTTNIIDLATSSRNANVVSVNSSTAAAAGLSFFDTRSIDTASRALTINPNSTIATVTNRVLISNATDVWAATGDGITYAKAMEVLVAGMVGNATTNGATIVFKKRDGTTASVTVTYDASGNRSASTTL